MSEAILSKTEVENWMAQILEREQVIESERDRIDDLIDRLEGLREVCSRAADSLEEARTALSELV